VDEVCPLKTKKYRRETSMFDLDSTGHVYMVDPQQQEMENDYFARYDADRERFSSEIDTEPDWYPDVDEPVLEATPAVVVVPLIEDGDVPF
jgi:hypothetical protein